MPPQLVHNPLFITSWLGPGFIESRKAGLERYLNVSTLTTFSDSARFLFFQQTPLLTSAVDLSMGGGFASKRSAATLTHEYQVAF